MALVFAVMHLYIKRYCFSPFLKKNLVLINRRKGPRYQCVLVLCAFLTGAIPKGLLIRKCVYACVCMCSSIYICVRTDFVDLENLCFDDLENVCRITKRQVEVCF